ncbi:DUF1648 domain-containing protein [Melissospora conviva]|uniref:DUF1648 domain-containing protein n=1 Tax=Melissospora conviva TaxID=3388432 RepID=UPI003B783B59
MTRALTPEAVAERRTRRTAVAVTAVGLLVVAVAALISYSWRGDLPERVATHWNVNGNPDSFGSFGALLALTTGLGVAMVAGFGALTAFLGQSALNRRVSAGATVWAGLFVAVLQLGTFAVQRGLTDAREAGSVDLVIVGALVGALIPAVLVALLVPGDPPQPAAVPVADDAPRVRLAAAERASWIGRVDGGPGIGIGVGVTVLLVVLAVLGGMWVMLVVPALLAALMAAMLSFVVRVDADGLTVRSALGWPRTRVPVDEVLRADVVPVNPLRQFGGWGWRVGRGGRVGIVLRKGEGLLVERTGGRSIVVTVDDAATAAALLNTLADRNRG